VHNYQGIRYIVKEDKYQEFDRKLVQETLKIFKTINYKVSVEEMDMNLSTTASIEPDLEMLIDTFSEAMQSVCKKTFKTTVRPQKELQKGAETRLNLHNASITLRQCYTKETNRTYTIPTITNGQL
jgi:hypothetical protein